MAPTVAPDGSKLAYHAFDDLANYVVTIGATAAHLRSRRKIVENSGWSYSWSPNGAWLFYAVRAERWGVEASHVSSGRKHIVFQDPGYDLTYFHLSPDNRWAVASTFSDPVSQIQIAPFKEAI